jgi:hypothetical protein
MRQDGIPSKSLAGTVILLAGVLSLAGCGLHSHPNDEKAISELLAKNQLLSVTPLENREAGVITLNGIVDTAAQKAQAEALAQQGAPGYRIVDNLQIRPTGLEGELMEATAATKLDQQIVADYKASIKKTKDLRARNIYCFAQGGTLTLRGTVKTEAERKEAGEIAGKVPQVERVVNGIVVTPSQVVSSKR